MPSPSIPVGGVAQDQPAIGDPLSRATTPVAGQTHDIVIGGVGFTLYRANTDDNPSKVYTSEAVDYTYTPTFIPRNNSGQSYSDDQQDFFMNQTQRDWSAGEGSKYFRQGQSDRGYWAGEGVQPTLVPGQVRQIAPVRSSSGGISGAGTGGVWVTLYVKGTGQIGGTNDPGDTLARVGIIGTSSTIALEYSVDGGATWVVQATTAASTAVKDTVDACLGDDGYVYVLEGMRNTNSSAIHRIKAPSLASVAWENWTPMSKQASCIAYFQGGVYVGDSAGRLVLTVVGGTVTVIKDFGGGVITQLLSTPEGLYVMYLSPQGTYKVFLYTSGQPAEVLNLPKGWRQNYAIESGVWPDRTASGIFAMASQAMAWSEGVLYISGLTPARDHQQSRRGEANYHSALYYYSAGNSGYVWECETAPIYHHSYGAACTAPIMSGMIAWIDHQNTRVMCYDPRTGGVSVLGVGTESSQAGMGGTTSGTITTAVNNNTGTTLAVTGFSSLMPGTLISQRDASAFSLNERMMVLGSGDFSNASPLNLKRGWNGTTAMTASTGTTGATLTIAKVPMFPPTHMTFDYTNCVLTWDYNTIPPPANILLGVGGNVQPYLPLRTDDTGGLGVQPTGSATNPSQWLQTSLFDFDSSLSKYFRTVQVDYDTLHMPARTDEAAGQIFGWYKLDTVMNRPHDDWSPPTDLQPLNQVLSTTIISRSGTTSTAAPTLWLTSSTGVAVGQIIKDSATNETAVITAIAGLTVTIGRRGYMGGKQRLNEYTSPIGFATGATVTVVAPLTSGTRYAVNATGKSIQIHLEFMGGATAAATPITLGPLLRKIVVRGVPIQPGYRQRDYQLALFNDQPRISSGKVTDPPRETRTPAEMRAAMETLLAANAPVVVSDGTMTSVTCAFLSDQCKFREIRPNEYIGYISLREV